MQKKVIKKRGKVKKSRVKVAAALVQKQRPIVEMIPETQLNQQQLNQQNTQQSSGLTSSESVQANPLQKQQLQINQTQSQEQMHPHHKKVYLWISIGLLLVILFVIFLNVQMDGDVAGKATENAESSKIILSNGVYVIKTGKPYNNIAFDKFCSVSNDNLIKCNVDYVSATENEKFNLIQTVDNSGNLLYSLKSRFNSKFCSYILDGSIKCNSDTVAPTQQFKIKYISDDIFELVANPDRICSDDGNKINCMVNNKEKFRFTFWRISPQINLLEQGVYHTGPICENKPVKLNVGKNEYSIVLDKIVNTNDLHYQVTTKKDNSGQNINIYGTQNNGYIGDNIIYPNLYIEFNIDGQILNIPNGKLPQYKFVESDNNNNNNNNNNNKFLINVDNLGSFITKITGMNEMNYGIENTNKGLFNSKEIYLFNDFKIKIIGHRNMKETDENCGNGLVFVSNGISVPLQISVYPKNDQLIIAHNDEVMGISFNNSKIIKTNSFIPYKSGTIIKKLTDYGLTLCGDKFCNEPVIKGEYKIATDDIPTENQKTLLKGGDIIFPFELSKKNCYNLQKSNNQKNCNLINGVLSDENPILTVSDVCAQQIDGYIASNADKTESLCIKKQSKICNLQSVGQVQNVAGKFDALCFCNGGMCKWFESDTDGSAEKLGAGFTVSNAAATLKAGNCEYVTADFKGTGAYDEAWIGCQCKVGPSGVYANKGDKYEGYECKDKNWVKVPTVTVQNEICTDTDNGKDYSKKGIITFNSKTADEDGIILADVCHQTNINQLTEYYCENNNYKTESYTCPIDFVCKDGACITKSPPPPPPPPIVTLSTEFTAELEQDSDFQQIKIKLIAQEIGAKYEWTYYDSLAGGGKSDFKEIVKQYSFKVLKDKFPVKIKLKIQKDTQILTAEKDINCPEQLCGKIQPQPISDSFTLACKDTDPLQNPYLEGAVSIGTAVEKDSCNRDDKLKKYQLLQYSCKVENDKVSFAAETSVCEFGCHKTEGKCLTEAEQNVQNECKQDLKLEKQFCGKLIADKNILNIPYYTTEKNTVGSCKISNKQETCEFGCKEGKCLTIDSCLNGVQDFDTNEAGIDCGGSCSVKCSIGTICKLDADCSSAKCDKITKKCVVYASPDNDDLIPCVNDVDSGKDQYTAGITYKFGKSYSDICAEAGDKKFYLSEFSCNADAMVKTIYLCLKGCKQDKGACVQ